MSRALPESEKSLAPFRAQIDIIDAEIVALLAKRFEVVRHVVAVKRVEGIAALLPERVEDVVEKVRAEAEAKGVPPELVEKVRAEAEAKGVPPELVETLWRDLIAFVVAYEEKQLG